MKCENCPANYYSGTPAGPWGPEECDTSGCILYGEDAKYLPPRLTTQTGCKLAEKVILIRIEQMDDYQSGKIPKPRWRSNAENETKSPDEPLVNTKVRELLADSAVLELLRNYSVLELLEAVSDVIGEDDLFY